jgi:hypothetical protein
MKFDSLDDKEEKSFQYTINQRRVLMVNIGVNTEIFERSTPITVSTQTKFASQTFTSNVIQMTIGIIKSQFEYVSQFYNLTAERLCT